MSMSLYLRAAALASILPLMACVVESESSATASAGPSGSPLAPAPPPSDTSGASASPVLVDVDTNQTMNAAPGEGAGVFIEYTAGGHWHVWWTCDTNVNPARPTCAFDVKVSVTTGAISNVKAESIDKGDSLTNTAKSIEALTTTTTGVDGVLFDTNPGGVITLAATLGGQYSGDILFFVQDGKVNGGYKGTLTDPLMLEGTTP